ncbi:MAG: carcinine hydrolase/isopenicillin-N N-acyltransferase family protein [Candidatus Aminicenantaceae bacterium]
MKKRNYKLGVFVLLALILSGAFELFPCTVAVASGKATPDGRPLMWKNRDTSVLDNKVLYLKGVKYGFIGIVNADDKKGEHVWAGINTEGFAIMNSASADLAEKGEKTLDNGRFMKIALGECANIRDFENILKRTKGKRDVGANFGVIDAEGNACIYETSSTGFEKFDANDPRVAPSGYIIRTNYAFTSPVENGGGGYIRFERALRLFQAAYSEGRLDYKFIIQQVSRDLVNEKLHSHPLSNPEVSDSSTPFYVNTNDTINRNSTASVAVFHGVSSPENAYLSTMWVLLGQPVCTVAVPLWASASDIPSALSGSGNAYLNNFSRGLASFLYPDRRGHMYQYMNVTRLRNYGGDGVLKKLIRIESQVFAKTEEKLREWQVRKPTGSEINNFEGKISEWVFESLKSSFPHIKYAD